MSVQSEINRITSAVADAYDAVDDMGGTLPATQNVGNLADAILTIPSGGGTGGITQDQNGYLVLDDEGGGGSSGNAFWLTGTNAVKIFERTETFNLEDDTTYSSITPSTTAQTIKTSSNIDYAVDIDISGYDVVTVLDGFIDYNYATTPSNTYFVRSASKRAVINYRYIDSTTGDLGSYTSNNMYSVYVSLNSYYNSSNSFRYSTGSTYGVYFNNTLPTPQVTISKTNDVSIITSIRLSGVQINCRASTSYMSTDSFSLLDTSNTTLTLRVQVYKVDTNYGTRSSTMVKSTLDTGIMPDNLINL